MKCKLSEKCEFGNLCKDATRHDSLTVLGCSSFKTKKPLTNEEWFISLPTEEKAKFIFWQHFDVYGKTLYELMVNASRGVSRDKQAEVMIGAVIEWLKEKHNDSM